MCRVNLRLKFKFVVRKILVVDFFSKSFNSVRTFSLTDSDFEHQKECLLKKRIICLLYWHDILAEEVNCMIFSLQNDKNKQK